MEDKKVGGSTLARRHTAETKKFEAEEAALRAEVEKLYAERDRLMAEAGQARLDLEESTYLKAFQDHVDARHRTYNLVGDIDENTIDELVTNVNSWARLSKDPIVIRVNSPGGSVYAGLALYDQLRAIDQYKAPVTTVAMGMTASMAGIITQGGSRRLITPSATFLVHEVSIEFGREMSRSELADVSESIKQLNSRLYRILAARSTLSEDEISKRAERKDWEMTAEEALQYGLADEIGYV